MRGALSTTEFLLSSLSIPHELGLQIISVLERLRHELAGLAFRNAVGQIEHVRVDLLVRDVVEIVLSSRTS
jgi:hypothetical protein